MWRKEKEILLDRKVNWCSHYGKHYGGFSKKKKNATTNPGYISEENKNTNLKRYIESNVHSSINYNSQHMGAILVDKRDTGDVNNIYVTHVLKYK